MERIHHIGMLVKTGVPIRYTYEWQDKAGGYGIQTSFGAKAIKAIKGDYYNVVGLPLSRLYYEFKKLGIL